MVVNIADLPRYEEYKDSGSDWLGKIPSSWKLISLKHLLQFHTGGTPSSGNQLFYDGDLPWITIADLNGRYTNKSHFLSRLGVRQARIPLTPKGSLLYSFKLSIGQVAFASEDLYTNEAIASFLPRDGLHLRYYFYALPIFLENNAGTNIYGAKLLNQDLIMNASILKVSPTDQLLIANFLDKKATQIDEAIAIKEQQIALLKERKQIIIQKAVTQGLDPNVPMKDSGVDWVGRIPAHWDMKRVKNIFRLVMEPSEKNNDYELLSVYTDIGVKPRRELEERGNKASTTDGYWFVKKGDIVVNKLLAWMGAIGLSEYDGVTSPAYDILRPQLPVNGFFYHYLFRSGFCSAELKRHSRGIMDMRLRLYFDRFGVIEVPYPPVNEQNEIIHSLGLQMKEMDKGIDHLNIQIDKLKEYKATLINSAVTGKIKVTPEMAGMQDAIEA